MKTVDKVISIINGVKESKQEVTLQSNLRNDLGIDSFDALMIMNELEDSYKITFKGQDYENLETVGDIVNILETKYLK